MDAPLRVEVWSDVVCPWCFIGKRRFERAVASLRGEIEVDTIYRPYQLDPRAPIGETTPVIEAYARKFGGPEQAAAIIDRVTRIAAEDGIEFRLDRARRANTFDAHRLLWFASHWDDEPRADQTAERPQQRLKERLLLAYFNEGRDLGDHATLEALAEEVGIDRDPVRSMLEGDDGAEEVRADLAAATELGITGVPAYVIERMWTIPGAQDTEVFVQVLRRVAERRGG